MPDQENRLSPCVASPDGKHQWTRYAEKKNQLQGEFCRLCRRHVCWVGLCQNLKPCEDHPEKLVTEFVNPDELCGAPMTSGKCRNYKADCDRPGHQKARDCAELGHSWQRGGKKKGERCMDCEVDRCPGMSRGGRCRNDIFCTLHRDPRLLPPER